LPDRKDFQLSWIYVEDLVEVLHLAARRGQRLAADQAGRGPGQGIYYVALDAQPSFVELADLAASIQGRPAVRTMRIPAFLCWLAAGVNGLRTRLTGRTHWLNPDKLREALAGSWVCSPDKAKHELGFSCRTDLAAGFRIIYEWYRYQGLL
jgi:nucleoside-diphosphate-sugar epimerase